MYRQDSRWFGRRQGYIEFGGLQLRTLSFIPPPPVSFPLEQEIWILDLCFGL